MQFIKNNFRVFEVNGKWTLFLNHPVYKEINSYGSTYIRNTKTGENCGQHVELHCHLYDDCGNKLDTPVYDEDCYEVVREET